MLVVVAPLAARLVLRYMGRDYFAQPGDRRDDDEIIDELMETAELSADDDEDR